MGFRFRQFEIEDTRSAMRVGTDSMLLGAWADPTGASEILDIGTGCGVLALMIAQKSTGHIDALDIDNESVEEARENISNCIWRERIDIFHADILTFSLTTAKRYDFIISNPPFFSNSLKSGKERKNRTRHDTSLTLADLCNSVTNLLTAPGKFCTILPAESSVAFEKECMEKNLFLSKKTTVFPKPGSRAKRVMLEFTMNMPEKPVLSDLVILNDTGGFSAGYLEMTREYHQF